MAAERVEVTEEYFNTHFKRSVPEKESWQNETIAIAARINYKIELEFKKDSNGNYILDPIKENFSDYSSLAYAQLKGTLSGTRTYAFIYTMACSLSEYGRTIECGFLQNSIADILAELKELWNTTPRLGDAESLCNRIFGYKKDGIYVKGILDLLEEMLNDVLQKADLTNSNLDKLLASLYLAIKGIDLAGRGLFWPASTYYTAEMKNKITKLLGKIEAHHAELLKAKEKRPREERLRNIEANKAEEQLLIAMPANDLDRLKFLVEEAKVNIVANIEELHTDSEKEKILSEKKFYKNLSEKIQAGQDVQSRTRLFFTCIEDRNEFEDFLKKLGVPEEETPAYLTTYDSYQGSYYQHIWHYASGISLTEENFSKLFNKIIEKAELSHEEKYEVERFGQVVNLAENFAKLFSLVDEVVKDAKNKLPFINSEVFSLEARLPLIDKLITSFYCIHEVCMTESMDLSKDFKEVNDEVGKLNASLCSFKQFLENKKNELEGKSKQHREKQKTDDFMAKLKEGGPLERTYNKCIADLREKYKALQLNYNSSAENAANLKQFKDDATRIIDAAIGECSVVSRGALNILKQDFRSMCHSPRSSPNQYQSRFFQPADEIKDLLQEEISTRKDLLIGFILELQRKSDLSSRPDLYRNSYKECVKEITKAYEIFLRNYAETTCFSRQEDILNQFEKRIREIIMRKIQESRISIKDDPLIDLNDSFHQLFVSEEGTNRAAIRNSIGK